MEHFAIHKLSKTHTSLLPKVSNSLCCGNPNSAVYFYHSDHLGSASWITNDSGNPVQHLQYMPYGEPFVNERTTAYEEHSYSPLLHYHYVSTSLTMQIPAETLSQSHRLCFIGKERDSETGFSYFGARYYDSDILTAWLSVDPLSDKYPGLSPYAYCAWNPVRLVDPDGEEIWIVNSNGDRLKYTIGMSSKGFDNYTTETINALNKLSQTKTLALEMQKMTYNSAISINITESTVTEYNFKEYEGISDKIPNEQKVSFNPYYALESIRSKKVLSPALALGHELGHVYQSFYETSNFLSRRKMVRIDVWNDEEEIHNILNYEYGIANEWNELMRMGHKLTDEDGNKIYNEITTVSSTSVLKNE